MGAEFRVNSYQDNWQRNPHITTFADGGFLVVWESYLNDYEEGSPSATYVAAQRYNAAGQRVGGEQLIDGIDGCSSADARVTTLRDGGYVVVWAFDDEDDILTVDTMIYARVYNANGTARTDAIRVDTAPSAAASMPDVAALGDGGFRVSWANENAGATFDDIHSRSFTAGGVPRTADTQTNTVITAFDQLNPRSCTLNNGNSVTVWSSEATYPNGGGGDCDIRATIYAPGGAVIRQDVHMMMELGSAGYEGNYGYDVTPLANGGFAVCALDYSHSVPGAQLELGTFVLMAMFDANGNRTTARLPVIETGEVVSDANLTQLSSGEIVVTWVQRGPAQGEIGHDVYARIFNAAGQPLTGAFEVGFDVDSYTDQTQVEIAGLAGGGFVISYTSEAIDADGDGVAARIFGRGTAGNDALVVDATGSIFGLAGNDSLSGDTRNNVIDGGTGNDRIADTRGGSDRLYGGQGDDIIVDFAGNDQLWGGAGNDQMQAGVGNDLLSGAAGNDLVHGGGGIDTAVFVLGAPVRADLTQTGWQNTGEGLDRLVEIENLTSGAGNDVLIGNGAANVLAGGAGNDVLTGGAGNDVLAGGDGADILAGGLGRDILTGAADARSDVFVFTATNQTGLAGNADVITDFHRGTDLISLNGIDANVFAGGDQAFAWTGGRAAAHAVWAVAGTGGWVLSGDVNGDARADFQIWLQGANGLGASDLLL